MIVQDFKELLSQIRQTKCETQTLEIKKAKDGAPSRLYDTLSSFSNQDDGGIIVFGIDESSQYDETGVYDAQDLQKKISEQCKDMEPSIRPLLAVFEVNGKIFVTAEIPGLDITQRPCFYKGKGRLKGAYIRVGDCDELMTEYEIYSYEAYRERHQDDIRIIARASPKMIPQDNLQHYYYTMKKERPNFARLSDPEIAELTNVMHDGQYTLSAVLMFGIYPQSFFPQLCLTAVRIPGTTMGSLGSSGARFLDNRRIEGNIKDMFDQAMLFVQANIRTQTIINPHTGQREDKAEYPIQAVREAVLNALAHRDYSSYSEGMPIQLLMYSDRMELRNPGGLYGRLRVDQLGKVQPDTRNPVLVSMMEAMGMTENRYSGIPTMRAEMKAADLPEPEFIEERGSFVVRFFNESKSSGHPAQSAQSLTDVETKLLHFCQTPRTKEEIANFLQIETIWYAINKYVAPLVERRLLIPSLPDKPKSPKQRYQTIA